MYIGTTSTQGLHHLVWEIIDNSVDEALAGYAHTIEISVDNDDVVTVKDDGRGMPTEIIKYQEDYTVLVHLLLMLYHNGLK